MLAVPLVVDLETADVKTARAALVVLVDIGQGRFAAVVPASETGAAIDILRGSGCPDAVAVGTIADGPAGVVILESSGGGERVLDVPAGEQLPRIC